MYREHYPMDFKDQVAFNTKSMYREVVFGPVKGSIIFEIRDAKTGQVKERFTQNNVVTYDAGIHTARLFKDNAEPAFGAYMLAIGTGATGNVLSPDAADPRQRKLNTEIQRKPVTSSTFRTTSGVAVAYPTNIVDFTFQFLASEAVGALNEMGIISPISSNPATTNPNPNAFPTYDASLDITTYDVLLNYLTFGVKTKTASEILTITWRLTFGSGS